MLTRRRLLSLVTSGIAACSFGRDTTDNGLRTTEIESALQRGAAWLWGQQTPDGGFHSSVYRFMAGGASLTPFALLSLARIPETVVPLNTSAASRGLRWLLSVSDDGAVGSLGPAPDYPVYATSMAISAFATLAPTQWRTDVLPMARWLANQQLRTDEGWAGHPAAGGFPLGGIIPTPPHSGHVDLSMTRRALEALSTMGMSGALKDGRRFVERCQSTNGGFIYSPVEAALNKGVRLGDEALGYGTATADGVLALLACDVSPEDPRILRALTYLHGIHDPEHAPGVGGGIYSSYAVAMRGYWRATVARVYTRLNGPMNWRPALAKVILREQQPSGHWINPNPAQKEDEPIIATGFALTALSMIVGR